MIKHIYGEEWKIFKRDYLRGFLWITIVSIVLSIIGYLLLLLNESAVMEAMEGLTSMFESKGIHFEMTQWQLFKAILINNLRAALFVTVLGFIPIVILPGVSAVFTSITISILLAFVAVQGQNPLPTLLLGILPHGIIELIGLILSGSIGVYLSLSIARKLVSKKRSEILLGARILQVGKTFLLVVTPLILIAAIIEAYITPYLLMLYY